MEFVVILFIAAIIIIVFKSVVNANNKKNSSYPGGRGKGFSGKSISFAPWPAAELPVALGIPYGHPARSAAERLEASLGIDVESRVKDRVLKEFPKMQAREWDWTWFELKRYFLMCGILRGVPMYSRQADALWHEMLMFTREYEQFCQRFCGEMIHHAPHAPGAQPMPDERAWFDWVYGELFPISPASGRVWGAFYRSRLSDQKLAELSDCSDEELREKWFNMRAASKHADLNATTAYLIDRAKAQLGTARRNDKPRKEAAQSHHGYDPLWGGAGVMSGLLIYHSVASPEDFAGRMDQELTEEERQASSGGGSSYACNGSSDDDRNSGGSDHSDGGSDGDSGGGSNGGGDSSCGSSCGGGGCSS